MNGTDSTQTFAAASWRLLGWLLDIIACAALAWSVSLNARVMKLELWQAGTTTTFYSSSDHLAYASQQQAELNKIWLRLADIESERLKEIGRIETQIATLPQTLQNPPKWWEEYVKSNLIKLDARLEKVEVYHAQRIIREQADKTMQQ